jgi:UDP-N-acetylglucosamine--dolichyl-phosphate N-acetylglucosaminephosphotransferase
MTAATNAFNLLAGFNGLEAGLSIIIFTTISFISFMQGNITLLIVLACWVGALIGFLKFNKYPSRIFPGDIVTLVSGSLAGISAIVLHMEFLIGFLVLLYIIEFFIKLSRNFKTECFGIPQRNGTIKPNPKGGSLTHLVLRTGKFTEKKLVWTFYIIQIIISGLTIMFYYLAYW